MTTVRTIAVSLALLSVPSVYGQKNRHTTMTKVTETTVCKVLHEPSAFDNKFVKIRGYVHFWDEGSYLLDDKCPNQVIWFGGFGDVTLPGLVAIVPGSGTKASGQRTGTPVRVVRDANFEEFARYMSHNAKAQACLDGPPPDLDHLADCMTYRITATFTGRIDGVPKSVHEAHLRRKIGEGTDWKGFGHMGKYDAQIVVQSVENIMAVDESETRSSNRSKDPM